MMGSPKTGQKITVFCCCRETAGDCQWLIAVGMNMGRWTRHFGIHCCADDKDNVDFVRYIRDITPNAKVVRMTLDVGDLEPEAI